jgi:hypothetical protein
MTRLITALACLALAAPAIAEPDATPAKATPAKAKTAQDDEAKPACKRKVIGRGLERKVVCEFEAPLVVKTEKPRPKVLIVPRDGRAVVGRPKQTDPLTGLSNRLR